MGDTLDIKENLFREVERDVGALHVSSQIVQDGRGPLVKPHSHISVEVC